MLPNVSKASQSLDVSVLHTLILEKIFGIDKENMAKQINLTYTKFFTEAIDGVDKGEFNAHLYSTLQELPKFVMLPPQEKKCRRNPHISIQK